jgi:predicted ATPase
LERSVPTGYALDVEGRRQQFGNELLASETALGALQDAARFPDLYQCRRSMLEWRFYHGFRTDQASPLRRPCLAVTTPTLSSDGSDLAAVFATLAHIREDVADLDRAVDDAFPGARLTILEPDRMASFGMVFPEYPRRTFEASELSDGTLRYLALAGALLAYRVPPLIALNEPETSLHPDLLDPLARMIVRASERTQVWLVTHSERLAAALSQHGRVTPRTVVKRNGETWIEGLRLAGGYAEEDDE